MTLDLKAIRDRADKATEGPWFVGVSSSDGMAPPYFSIGNFEADDHYEDTIAQIWGGNHDYELNAAFIAHARTDIPALLDEIDRLEIDRDAWRLAFKDMVELKTQAVHRAQIAEAKIDRLNALIMAAAGLAMCKPDEMEDVRRGRAAAVARENGHE